MIDTFLKHTAGAGLTGYFRVLAFMYVLDIIGIVIYKAMG